MNFCAPYICLVPGEAREGIRAPETGTKELVVNCHLYAGNQIRALNHSVFSPAPTN